MNHIRNFSIIAHIDHGKSTLADRMLEVTNTVPTRKMRDQVLDQMDLERERGITIKMQPVRMNYSLNATNYVLNLIDTPGHIDFAYEVSRALTAVEGVLLLVDSTQGIQAQTLATLAMARDAGCVIIPVLSKIDMPASRVSEVRSALARLLDVPESEVLSVSGKTGEGVAELLVAIVERVPPPYSDYGVGGLGSLEQAEARLRSPELRRSEGGRALVFDFSYSEHRGVVAYVRVTDGEVRTKDTISFMAVGKKMTALETGWLVPAEFPTPSLSAGDIGYVVTGIKEPGVALVGDTIKAGNSTLPAYEGYSTPKAVVWASLYPDSQDGFTLLKQALMRLKLSDAALSFEEDGSSVLGKGFRCGFLGMLHMEIVTERLTREFSITPVITTPSIMYEVTDTKGKTEQIYTPTQFPPHGMVASVREQWVNISIIIPPSYLSPMTQLLYEYEATIHSADLFGLSGYGDDRLLIKAEMPLRELMRGFFDRLKSVSSGFASLSYEFGEFRPATVTRLDVLVAEELVPAFSRIISERRVEEEARAVVEKLANTLPRQQFVLKIQSQANGRIIASRSLSAMRKDVTSGLYGGDVSRKKKVLEKQKRGKERRGGHAKVQIPPEVFLKMIKPDSN